MSRKPDARGAVRRFLKWLDTPPEDGEHNVLELHPLGAPSAKILRLVEALRDPGALELFFLNVVSVMRAARILGVSEEAVLALVERGELRGLYTGGERQWAFSTRRIQELAAAAEGLRAAEKWFTDHGYKGFASHERP